MVDDNSGHLEVDQLDLLTSSKDDLPLLAGNRMGRESPLNNEENNLETILESKHKVRKLLIIDTETTGLDPKENHCIEVGAILFEISNRIVLAQYSSLLPVSSNEAELINRIPAHTTKIKQPWQQSLVYLESLVDSADLIVAHNVEFDKQWFGKNQLPSISKPWLCTMEDIRWPADRQLRIRPSVRDLALAYGVPVWSAHRALTDCIYISEVFMRCENLEELISHGLEPRKLMKAEVSYDQRHLAREAGFRWNNPVHGAWTRRLSLREASSLAFSVVEVKVSS